MDTKLSKLENEILGKAENDFFEKGNTLERCPRCGNNIIMEGVGNSYSIKCASGNCISMSFRGI